MNKSKDTNKCPNCGGDITIRNPKGACDHLYYPENVKDTNKEEMGWEVQFIRDWNLGTFDTESHRSFNPVKIKDFIRSTLKQEKLKLLEEIVDKWNSIRPLEVHELAKFYKFLLEKKKKEIEG